MIIDEYRKKQKVLEQELERLKEEYNMPDDYFEDPEVSREIINNLSILVLVIQIFITLIYIIRQNF